MEAQAQEQAPTPGIEERIPAGEYERHVRVTRHAIDKMLERSKEQHVDWSLARNVEDIGNAIDRAIRDARERGLVTSWWESNENGTEQQVDVAEIDLGRDRRPVYAVIVPSDMPGGRHRLAVLTILYERQFHGSVRNGRFTKQPRREAPAKLVGMDMALAAAGIQVTADRSFNEGVAVPPGPGDYPPVPDVLPTRSARAGTAASAPGIVHVPGDGHRDTKPSNVEEHTAEVAHVGAKAAGALLTYESANGPATMELRSWDDVPGAISDIVEQGVAIETIATYRRVPLKVRRAITVTLGEE